MLELERPIRITDELCDEPNLTDRFTEVDLRRIGLHVFEGYKADLQSRSRWEEMNKAGMDLALQIVQEKSFPWPGASNVAFPLVTIAAMQFHARAYPTLINGREVVKVNVRPEATQQEVDCAIGAARCMNQQLLDDSSTWEEQVDRALLHISIVGCGFKKTYYGNLDQRVESDLVMAKHLVVDYYAKSVESARRKSHWYTMSRNSLIEGMRQDPPRFRSLEKEEWFKQPPQTAVELHDRAAKDGTEPPAFNDASRPFEIIEQHTWLDLDNDGYEEPYVVTIEASRKEVIRITARWERPVDVIRNGRKQIVRIVATEHFTKYGFIPNPDGSLYDIGFGVLLGPLNESVSTIVNQLIDAGTMQTTGGGFIAKGAKVRGGTLSFGPNEWRTVEATGDDLRKSIVPNTPPQVSPVLFQLLGLLIDYTNRIAGTMETMVGENPGQNTPKANMDAMIEQGMKIYAAIFKRIWRAMKEEFRKIYILNGIYGPASKRRYFLQDPRRCSPVAAPNVSSEAERRSRAILIAERATVVPGYDPMAVEMNFLEAMNVEDPKRFYKGPPQAKPQPDPKIVVQQMKMADSQAEREHDWKKFLTELMASQKEQDATVLKLMADAQRALAQAEGEKDNRLIVAMQTTLSALKQRGDADMKRVEQLIRLAELESEPERKTKGLDWIRRLALASGNGGSPPVREAQGPGLEGQMGPQTT